MLFSSTARSGSGSASTPKSDAMDTSNAQRDDEHSWSHYERLVRKLYMTNLFNPVKLGLENMDTLHKALGSPMDQVSLQ